MRKEKTIKLSHEKELKVNYLRLIKRGGQEMIELISFSKKGKDVVSNPPDYTEVIDKLLKILKGTGISKITISFLDKNIKAKD